MQVIYLTRGVEKLIKVESLDSVVICIFMCKFIMVMCIFVVVIHTFCGYMYIYCGYTHKFE